MLYKRDYTLLTDEERRGWDRAEKMIRSKKVLSAREVAAYGRMIPLAVQYYMQLFPNNYLCPAELEIRARLCRAKEGLLRILDDPQAGEREILNFVRDNEYYFLVGSLFLWFDFGHHEAFLFREFPLGTEHVADYLLVGKNSGGYEFVFVEFESPRGAITTRTGISAMRYARESVRRRTGIDGSMPISRRSTLGSSGLWGGIGPIYRRSFTSRTEAGATMSSWPGAGRTTPGKRMP